MAKFNKTLTFSLAIVFLTIVRSSDISTSYNTSSKATSLDRSSTLSCWIVHRVTFVPLAGTLCALGLIGNSLSFAVLHMYSSGNVGAYLLKALSVTDNIFLATMLGVLIYERIDAVVPQMISDIVFALISATMSWTVWMIVIVAGNRYIAVCRPMVASRLCTINKVRLEILIMVGAVCVFKTPRFVDFCLKETIIVGNVTYEEVNCEGNMLYFCLCISLYICVLLAAGHHYLLQCPPNA